MVEGSSAVGSASRSSYERAARLIAAEAPSEAMVANLAALGPRIAAHSGIDDRLPTIADARARLGRMKKSLRDISLGLNNDSIYPFLDQALPEGIKIETFRSIADLSLRVDAALAGLRAGRNGPGRAVPLRRGERDDGLSGRQLCALIVALSWQRERGQLPGESNERAQEAAAELWAASGHSPIGKDGVAGWKTWLLQAVEPPSTQIWDTARRWIGLELSIDQRPA